MHTTSNLHLCLSQFDGLLQEVHQRVACIAQPLSEYLAGEGASKKSEQVSLTEDALRPFKALKQACMTAPILDSADYTKPFLLETDASKDELGAVLLQKQADGWYHPVTYIMSTPNLDAMGHWWVSALVQFNFELEYQKGHDNTVTDALSQVTTQLDRHSKINPQQSHTGNSALGWSSWPSCSWGKPLLGARDICHHRPHTGTNACYWLGCSQKEDPMLSTVFDWLKAQKTDLKALLAEHTSSEEGRLILHNW